MTNEDTDRIRLAEAMSWVKKGRYWRDPYGLGMHCQEPPDPFMLPEDDYAVLLWLRDTYSSNDIERAFDHIGFGHRWVYEKGFYAEAALALLSGEMETCSDCA